ncbi:MAG TPA: hypothetical protein VGS96_11795 [Thermoanaerobaculia bacterium]|nr:hypothetical protein [Thermoanaerobaculia bacterium]
MVALVVSGLAAVIVPSTASASDTAVLSIKAGTATADFSSVDSTGCVTTAVHVEVGEDMTKDSTISPQKSNSIGAYVTLSQIDQCNASERSAIGFTQDVLFQFDRQLTVATVRGPIRMCNADGLVCFDTALDLTWVGIGDLINLDYKDKVDSGGFKIVFHQRGDLRLSVARFNFYDADGSTNLTPDASTLAFIAWVDSRTVTISRHEITED